MINVGIVKKKGKQLSWPVNYHTENIQINRMQFLRNPRKMSDHIF